MQDSIDQIQSIIHEDRKECGSTIEDDLLANSSVCSDLLNRTNREIKFLQQKAQKILPTGNQAYVLLNHGIGSELDIEPDGVSLAMITVKDPLVPIIFTLRQIIHTDQPIQVGVVKNLSVFISLNTYRKPNKD